MRDATRESSSLNESPIPPNIIKNYYLAVSLIFFVSSVIFLPPGITLVRASETTPQTIISGVIRGREWAYLVPFEVRNKTAIEKLIGCESQGVNISRPDSNGLISWGILQFNGTSTWAEFSRKSGLGGSPINPPDAIRMADWMIDHGALGRWTCAHILHLIP